uniref:Uncharacterized protein n=1 Tax=Rhizophora mucronata TaxID=61149 RepID=A0A2P2KAW6_RHIMU
MSHQSVLYYPWHTIMTFILLGLGIIAIAGSIKEKLGDSHPLLPTETH